ncbi:MAG TPA: MBL fold metallo-hydrolase [Acidimicrobiales bacterium]
MAMTVTVLGACGSYPGPGMATSGYLVRDGQTTLWVDAGSGTLANLQRHVPITDVDAVVLTHEHPDHWSDINGFFVACRYYFGRERVPVYGPASVRQHVYYDDEPFQWNVVSDGDRAEVGTLSVRFSRTDHPPETLAVRVDGGGRSLAFSADTGPAWSFSKLGDGIHLALCEATFDREYEGTVQHLSGRQAGAMARAAGVERLVLTHLEPGNDRARTMQDATDTFGSPVGVAEENEEYDV